MRVRVCRVRMSQEASVLYEPAKSLWIPGQNKATSRSLCHGYKQTPSAIDEDVRIKLIFVDRKANLAQLRLQFRVDVTLLCVCMIYTQKAEAQGFKAMYDVRYNQLL